ncbi:hypothetical protein BGZ60DRAFT_404045 [Tricladium varicosporioides]|nr:hypothetical protein BGZ60DRAFT_404045 [Hymenoscyphus varicosporioides]
MSDTQPQVLLRQLAKELRSGKHGRHYKALANHIDNYPFKNVDQEHRNGKTEDQCKGLMVNILCEAINKGKSLRLGLPYSHPSAPTMKKKKHKSYCTIFISSCNTGWQEEQPSYIFTSYGHQKCVSLEVELDGLTENKPRLIIKGWANGLCFSNECHDQQVLFPWPPSLA